MISQIYWLTPNHILYWKMSGQIPGDELCAMAHFIVKLTDMSASQKVHIIISCTGVQQLDHATQDVREAFTMLANHKYLGKVAAITSNYRIQAHWNALNSAFGHRWENVSSLQAAIQALKISDSLIQSVPNLAKTSLITRPSSA